MSKLSHILWTAAAILLALSFCFLIPSGMLTDNARAAYDELLYRIVLV